MDYSPEYLRQVTGLCRATAKKALIELEEKNYLIQTDEKHYDFYDYPRRMKQAQIIFWWGVSMNREDRKQFYDLYLDGSKDYYYLTYGELEDTFGKEIANKIWSSGCIPNDYW